MRKLNVSYLILLILFTSCNNKEKSNGSSIIEKDWISDTKIGEDEKIKGKSSILSLKNGYGGITVIGSNVNNRFNYRLSKDSVIRMPSNEWFFQVTELSEDNLKISLDGKRIISYAPIELNKTNFDDLKNSIQGHTFHLKEFEKMIYFDEKELVVVSSDLLKKTSDFRTLPARRLQYSIDTIQGNTWIAFDEQVKGMKNPILGIIEATNDEIGIHSYINSDIEVTKLQRISKQNDAFKKALIGRWMWGTASSKQQIFEFFEDGKLVHEKDGEKYNLDWMMDDSGVLITFIEPGGGKKYGILDIHQDRLRMSYEYRKNNFSGLIKK